MPFSGRATPQRLRLRGYPLQLQQQTGDMRLMAYGFGKELRLLVAGDFSRVFSKPAIRVSSRHFLILAIEGSTECARVGLVISRKNVGNAVKRNRIKRLCREVFRVRQSDFARIDLVILARPGISLLSNKEVTESLQALLAKLVTEQGKNQDKNTRNLNNTGA